MEDKNLIPFEGKPIRKIWHNEEWYFSIIDVIDILTDSPQPSSYWNKVKKSILKENQSLRFWQRLKLMSNDSKSYLTDCTNAKGILRIIMSVPSFKAEPLKLWLAEVGIERIEETENPELSYERMTEMYRAQGRTELWITERLQSIATRNELTDEWKARGIKEGQEYGILTATIAKGTFGVTPSEHKELKSLDKQNLRDHMTRFELILTSLSEEVTRTIAVDKNAHGFNENHEAAMKGGQAGRKALLNVEEATGRKVLSSSNFLNPPQNDNDVLPESDKK